MQTFIAISNTPRGTAYCFSSWRKMTSSIGLPPRPPADLGQVMPAKPALALMACQRFAAGTLMASSSVS